MYSVVLLMALSGSADTPSLGWGCKGCCGCCGYDCSGCCGGCCGGWCGGGCGGGLDVSGGKAGAVAEGSAPATIVVNLPAPAKLTIDGNTTSSTSERRVFVSPALEAGQEYYYTLKAEINGEVKEERVTVKAGQEVAVKIDFPA